MQTAGFLRRMRQIKAEAAALAFISTWESAALLTGAVPTVTHTVMRLPRGARAVLVASAAAWLVAHFELDG